MVVGKDIVAISIPFSAGVALAAYLPPGEASPYIAAMCCVSAAILAGIYCGKGERWPVCMAMFFLAGMSSAFTAVISIDCRTETEGVTDRALQYLLGVIDGCSFDYSQTGPLVKALITGQRQGLSQETVKAFRDSGAVHILALSGLHMSVIYGILHKSLAWTGKGRSASVAKSVLIIAAAAFFTKMTGSGPSVVRAFLFISINEISRLFPGRRRRPVAVYCTALMIQLIANPLIIKSVSFQLSYLAMLAIFTLFPIMQSWYPENEGKVMRKLWTSAALSLSCQLYTAPLAWIYFQSFPVYFLVSNLVALPISEFLIFCAVITVAAEAAGICPEILKGLCDVLAKALVKSLEVISSL